MEVKLHSFLTLTLEGCGWSVSCSDCFIYMSDEKASRICWLGGWVGPRAGLGASETERRKLSCPACSLTTVPNELLLLLFFLWILK
jgi:hypothetical protein